MPVIRRSTAPVFALDGVGITFTGLAAPSRGSSETSVWEVGVPAGEAGASHSLDHEEVLIVHSGRVVVRLGEEDHELGPGDAAIAPANEPLCVSNPFDEPATLIAAVPVGTQARIGDGPTFTPPWTT
jgi:quercetin dioxygenase-like cupin family protein